MMRDSIKRFITIGLAGAMMTAGLSGCGQGETYDGYVFPEQPESKLSAF